MRPTIIQTVLGPRIPTAALRAQPLRFLAPTLLLAAAAVLLLISLTLPHWQMTLYAPQYPKGLHVKAYLNRLEGDVREIDGLNHYIGMRPLGEAARLERALAIFAVSTMALLVLAAIAVHTRWAALLALPTITLPAAFLIDLFLWMNHFGQNLDPTAALSSAIEPFTPPVLGIGRIGQFRTVAWPDVGLELTVIAAALTLVALWFHRRAYKRLASAGNSG